MLIVAAGNVKIDNRKYKDRFGVKASMIPGASVEELVGHAPGGVCPFGIREGVDPLCFDRTRLLKRGAR